MTILPPLSTGFKIGATTALAGAILDQESVPMYRDTKLYTDSWTLILFNLLFLGPLSYSLAETLTIRKGLLKTARDTVGMIIVHSGLYSLAHRAMHKVAALRPIHAHHHKFKEKVMPSSANAVSPLEFAWAYMLPFMVGAVIFGPSPAALAASTIVISSANLAVHSDMFKTSRWPNWLVSPREHLTHHLRRTPMYSAPTIHWRHLFSNFARMTFRAPKEFKACWDRPCRR